VQYLTNMGVRGSLVISLIHRGRLWGLISGHHYSGPRRVPPGVRSLCEFLAQALSLQVGAMDRLEDRDYALRVSSLLTRLVSGLGDEAPPEQLLAADPAALLGVTGAGGAAVLRQREMACVGATPATAEVEALAEWLREGAADLFESARLAADFAPAAEYADVASGVLAVPLSRDRRDWVLWFRGERRQTVRWAGDPRKPVTIAPDGSARLHPRGSFALWEEEVRGTSDPWRGVEVQAALDLRRALQDLLVRRAEEIAQLNRELALANAQLEETAVELEVQTEELIEQRQQRELALEAEREARAEAEGANQAKADFLAVMSHELRTPLNAIGGYAQIMSMGVRGPVTSEQLADLDRIAVNQRHLLGLINSILNYSKLEAGQVQFSLARVALRILLLELDALVGPQMRAKSLALEIGHCGTGVAVWADEEKLRQILLNLLTNALKFTPAGGSVSVSCEPGEAAVTIRVRDTGRGIAPAHLEEVFEPFVQVDRHVTSANDQGVGLGLAISRELARGMGGTLSAESELGRGSTFSVTLPAAADG
jgi:chemotaxis family two-component system sensor kinase Cph1